MRVEGSVLTEPHNLLSGLDVLLVEDEFMIAVDAQDILQALDARSVLVAATYEQAERRITQGGFSVAILDVNIHGKMSFPLGAMLKERGIPFIFATGYNLKDPTLSGVDGGVCVLKPYDQERIHDGLKEALRRSAEA
jgi:DNA-binding response OmpR family regulator